MLNMNPVVKLVYYVRILRKLKLNVSKGAILMTDRLTKFNMN